MPLSWDSSMPARLRAAIDQGVTEAAAYVQGALYRNLSGIEGGGPLVTRVSGRTGHRYRVGPGAPPGRFPFLRSGRLRQSAAYEPRYAVNGRIRVGVNTAYARALEFGTSRMAARPFLRRTFQQETQRVQQIIRNRVLVNMQFGGGKRA